MEWMNRSEVVFGKVLLNELSPHAVEPETLHPPFGDGIVALRGGASELDMLDIVGMTASDGAKIAARNINGNIDVYIDACRESASRVQAGRMLEPIIKRWSMGECKDGDTDKAIAAVGRMDGGRMLTTALSEAPALGEVWRPTGYAPIDETMFGIPESSLTVVGGAPGTGKTSFLLRLLINAAKEGNKVWFASLEMTLAQIAYRTVQIDKTMTHKAKQERILIADQALTLSEIYSEASRVSANNPDLHLIAVDFADMIVPDRSSAQGVAMIDQTYRTMASLAKQVDVPVIVLSQLNYNYVGGRPRVNHLRGSRLIEALAAMVILLYNPDQIDVEQADDELGYAGDGIGWIIEGKSRYGFKHGGPIAVPVPWEGGKGWSNEYGDYKRLYSI